MKRRDSTRVIRDILALAREGAAKTHIVYKANLNFRMVEPYLDFLTAKGFLVQSDSTGHQCERYHLSAEGRCSLDELQRVETQLEGLFSTEPNARAKAHHSRIIVSKED